MTVGPAVAAQQRLSLISTTHVGQMDSPSLRGQRPNPGAGPDPAHGAVQIYAPGLALSDTNAATCPWVDVTADTRPDLGANATKAPPCTVP